MAAPLSLVVLSLLATTVAPSDSSATTVAPSDSSATTSSSVQPPLSVLQLGIYSSAKLKSLFSGSGEASAAIRSRLVVGREPCWGEFTGQFHSNTLIGGLLLLLLMTVFLLFSRLCHHWIILLLLAGYFHSVAGERAIVVGGPSGWSMESDIQHWLMSYTFSMNDTLVFRFTGYHNVIEVSESDFDQCHVDHPIKVYSMEESDEVHVTLTRSGWYYFICGTPTLCKAGLQMKIFVDGGSESKSESSISHVHDILSVILF